MAEHFDLVVVGAGSGNLLFGHADLSDWRVAIVERDRFGGTCLNRGCIPSKMLVHTADVADTVRDAERFGVHAHLDGVDWPAVHDRVWNRLDPLPGSASRYREGRGSRSTTRTPGSSATRPSRSAARRSPVSASCWRPAPERSSPTCPGSPTSTTRPRTRSCAGPRRRPAS